MRSASLPTKTGTTVNDITNMTIWGNHSVTQYPDLFHAKVDRARTPTNSINDHDWVDGTYIPTVAKRGAAIIEARGASSAASAANAAVDHIRTWTLGTAEGDWVSMAIPSDGSYGVAEGLISSFPCTCKSTRGRGHLGRTTPVRVWESLGCCRAGDSARRCADRF